MPNWASRPVKAAMRDYLLPASHAAKTAIFLPGWDDDANTGCLCIQRGLELGTITLNSRIIAVERRRDLAAKIAPRLAGFGFTTLPYLHIGELHTLDLTGKKIDYAGIDLLGSITESVAGWVETQLAPALTKRAHVGFTLTRVWRSSDFMNTISNRWRLAPELRQKAMAYGRQMDIDDEPILLNVAVLKSLFSRYDVKYNRIQLYRDGRTTMIAFRLNHFAPARESDWPSTSEVLASLPPQEVY